MLFWLSYRHQHSHHYNGWCTQLLDFYVAFHQKIMWYQHSDLSIHCQLSRGLNSSSACLSIRPSMDEHLPTSRTWLKRRRRYLAELQNRSASNNDLVTWRTRLKLSERAFSIAAPRIWNQLPIDIKAATDIQVLKRKLKTHLFLAVYLQ